MNELLNNGTEAFEAVEANRGLSKWRLLVVMVVLGGSLAGATIIGISLLGGVSGRLDVAEGTDVAIQAERARGIRSDCEAQNMRHREAVDALDGFFARRPTDDPGAARDFTRALADAVVPVRDCDKLVRESVVEERK